MASLTASNLADAHIEKHGLAGKHVVVTGRTTGIDRAIALLLASEGAQALICSRGEKHLAEALALSQSVTVAIEREWPLNYATFTRVSTRSGWASSH